MRTRKRQRVSSFNVISLVMTFLDRQESFPLIFATFQRIFQLAPGKNRLKSLCSFVQSKLTCNISLNRQGLMSALGATNGVSAGEDFEILT